MSVSGFKNINTDGLVFAVDAGNGKSDNTVLRTQNVADFNDAEYLNADSLVSELATTTVGTWSFWFKFPNVASGNKYLVSFADTNAANYIHCYTNTGDRIHFEGALSGVTQFDVQSSVLSNQTWHHVALVQDGAAAKLYIDGVIDQNNITTLDLGFWLNDAVGLIDNGRIGNTNLNNNGDAIFEYVGQMRNVGIWNKAFTQFDVSVLYQKGRGLRYNDLSDNQKVGLVSWYNLDDDLLIDSHSSNNLTNNGVTLVSDTGATFNTQIDLGVGYDYLKENGAIASGGSWSFDGVNDYIDFGSDDPFMDSTGQSGTTFSVECWIKTNRIDGVEQTVVAKQDSASNGWQLVLNSPTTNKIRMVYGGFFGSGYMIMENDMALVSSTWYHIVATKDSGTDVSDMEVYINGSLGNQVSAGNTYGGTDVGLGASLRFGNREFSGGNTPFDGEIATTKIYNRPLSAAEVLQNYNATKFRFI